MKNKILNFCKIFSLTILSLIIFIVFTFYLFLVLGLPKILNSEKTVKTIEKYLSDKTNSECVISKQHFDISPTININYFLNNLLIENNSKKVLYINNLKIHLNLTGKNFISVQDTYIDIDGLKSILPKKNKNKKSSFTLNKLPEITINNLEINSKEKVEFYSTIQNFKIIKENKKRENIFFDANIILPKPLAPVSISSNKNLYIENNVLSASDLKVLFNENQITINGDILTPEKTPNLHISAKDLKSQDVVYLAIFLHNIADKHKKFLENFKKFTGYISVDLTLKQKKLNGIIKAKNLKAYTVLFNLPVICPETTITVKDNVMEGTSVGTAGTEKITHYFKITDLLSTPDRMVNGEVKSKISSRLVKKYLPEQYEAKGNSDIFITYHIKNQKINVKYYVDLKKGSDFYYKNANLGLTNKNRKFFVHTYKTGDNMYLKEYKYFYIMQNGKPYDIVLGNGLFIRINNKFKPQFITVKTNGYAPVSVIGGLGKYIWGGYFSGNLKYDFNRYKLTGVFSLINTYFNHFMIKNANVVADDKNLFVKANGTYRKEKFEGEMFAKNNLFEEDRMKVYNLNLFLDKYKIAKPHKTQNPHKKKIDISKYVRQIYMDVDKYNIKINSITLNRAVASNINIKGSIKNALFNFDILNIDFAEGKILAKGLYNFNNDSLHIDLKANNINSNIVADKVFDFPNYVVGIASADVHIDSYKRWHDYKGIFNFNIDGGYLPILGTLKFKTNEKKHPKFIKPQDYTNVDLSRTESLKSNIVCSFKLNNQHIYNLKLTSQHEALALFIEGEYNGVEPYYTDINIYGKYNKNATKRAKIAHIPLKWILNYMFYDKQPKTSYQTKLNKIPSINTPESQQKYFVIRINGDLNTDNDEIYQFNGLE